MLLPSWLIIVLREHFHALMFTYIGISLVICGLFAPDERMALLHSAWLQHGWQLSLLAILLVMPWPALYWLRLCKK